MAFVIANGNVVMVPFGYLVRFVLWYKTILVS